MYRRVPILLSACFLVFTLTAQSGAAEPNKLTDRVKEGEPVPSPLTFSSKFERIVIVRMTYGTDMLGGLVKAVKQEKIKNAVILSGIGSLTSYHVHVVSNTTFPSENAFVKDEGPYGLTVYLPACTVPADRPAKRPRWWHDPLVVRNSGVFTADPFQSSR